MGASAKCTLKQIKNNIKNKIMTQVKAFPVVVSEISLSKPTKAITGLETYAELVAQKSTIFADWTKEDCVTMWNQVHNNKLLDEQIEEFEKLSVKKMQSSIYNALILRVELKQETVRINSDGNVSENVSNNILSRNLVGRGNTLNITKPTKISWMYPTVQSVENEGYTEGTDLSELFKTNYDETVFIKRENSIIPKFDAKGNIISSPKRNGKNGAILLVDGKILFQHTEIVLLEGSKEEELMEAEIENIKSFKHDDIIEASDIPLESRDGLKFNSEFQNWVNELYTVQEKGMVKVS